jgi:hypothetical protein
MNTLDGDSMLHTDERFSLHSVVYGNIRDNERRLCHELSECVSDGVKRAASAQALLDVESECSN